MTSPRASCAPATGSRRRTRTGTAQSPDPGTSRAPYRLYNIGNNRPVELLRYIELLEQCLGRKAQMNMLPLQAGDVPDTWADIEDLQRDVGYTPATPVEVGIRRFVDWYLEYYGKDAPAGPEGRQPRLIGYPRDRPRCVPARSRARACSRFRRLR